MHVVVFDRAALKIGWDYVHQVVVIGGAWDGAWDDRPSLKRGCLRKLWQVWVVGETYCRTASRVGIGRRGTPQRSQPDIARPRAPKPIL